MRRVLGWLCTAAPFVAAAIAALSSRHDFRILSMSIVATVFARMVVAATARARGIGVAGGAAFVVASAAAAGAAVGARAYAVFGVVAVSVVIAAFATAGAVLGADVTRRLSG